MFTLICIALVCFPPFSFALNEGFDWAGLDLSIGCGFKDSERVSLATTRPSQNTNHGLNVFINFRIFLGCI